MKTNWPAVVTEYRKILVENVKFFKIVDDFGTIDKDFMYYFRVQVFQTDKFHPWDSDGDLSRALDKMPVRCNYRNIKSYWDFKNGKENIADGIFQMLVEAQDIINDYFSDSWNFEPGFKLPDEIEFPMWEDVVTNRLVARLIRAAKTPQAANDYS